VIMNEERERKSSSGLLILLLCTSPLLYVLSIGPVAMFAQRNGSAAPSPWIRQVYAPLIWLHAHTILEKPLEAYIRLWVK